MQKLCNEKRSRCLVVTKAVFRASDNLGLRQEEIARILGLSRMTISRMKKGESLLKGKSKEFELAVLLIQLCHSLDIITGGDDKVSASWIRNPNTTLNEVPLELMYIKLQAFCVSSII